MRLCILAALICTGWPVRAHAGPNDKPSEYDVEAAYLFNFSKFITWPAKSRGQSNPFVICILGDDPFGPVLDKTVSGEKVDGKSVIDKRIARAEEATGCSILYIGTSEASRLSKILLAVKDAPMLTVSDIPDFMDRGGMIQFVLRDRRVRFAVNLGPTQQDGLTLSSELLKVAVTVRRAEAGQ